jgi:hypothetical protein
VRIVMQSQALAEKRLGISFSWRNDHV